DYRFYGGDSESLEKRSRVKVRVVTNTLIKLVKKASNVVIMPHTKADLDAIGACLGMNKFVSLNNRKAYICADYKNLEQSTLDAYNSLDLYNEVSFYTEEQILKIIDEDTLLIIVDTSNTKIIESFKVYAEISNKVVIDHHRRANNFIENPVLVHIETYASSSVELVTELLQFQAKSFKLHSDIATLMLAGMMVDTDYFTNRTGVRTFEAATILRNKGANPLLAKELLQVSRDTYEKRLAMISEANYLDSNIAISCYRKEPVTRALLAQAAVELLDIKDIKATFMIGMIEDGSIAISARSKGDFNVQKIVEKFNGGGHFSMAAAQIKNSDFDEVILTLNEYINEELKG
ncbi:MAG: DHH family phosphoesterase, partial [Bacilli bacterium]